jgi:xylulokinase
MSDLVCAIDVGSSSIKGTLRKDVDQIIAIYKVQYPEGGFSNSQNAHEILWGAFIEVVGELLKNHEPSKLAISCQMAGFSAIDPQGKPVGPLIPGIELLIPRNFEIDLRLSGCWDPNVSTAAKLNWVVENGTPIPASTRIGGIKEYLLFRLTGSWVTDPASASSMGFYDIKAQAWSNEVMEYCGISEAQLPTIKPMAEEIGLVIDDLIPELNLRRGLSVICGLGDGPAANISVGAIGSEILCLSRGTTVVARVLTRDSLPDLSSLPFFTQHVAGSWKCVGIRLSWDPKHQYFIEPGRSHRVIRGEEVGSYLEPLLAALNVTEIRTSGKREIPLPPHWNIHEVNEDSQDGTRAMALVASGWHLPISQDVETVVGS